ncbi:MAG: type I DNA topoisomerase [Alphaproteobacteria bacterium]|nr:type I DNA topoisomerase [Alphaproteobacteria bacterium]
MNIVIVESPAKARTINRYLGDEYTVLASIGHVRDLPPKDGSVRPDDDFDMSWAVDARGETQLKKIVGAVKGASHLYLATDPDREGEAISWHVLEELHRRRALKDVDVKRVVFHEVTKAAVLEAMSHPRDLDQSLIDAYLARRALDYLVGFTLSPVLWRKLPGSKSAGRVQSVALRLICEREAEIEVFRPQEYWTVDAAIRTSAGAEIVARLTHIDGRKLGKFDLDSENGAETAAGHVRGGDFRVDSVERKTVRRNPPPPFTTSTLQQEASRKLGFGANRTMRTAQRLYEGSDVGGETVGLITYMRTDSVNLSEDAITNSRALIENKFGVDYLPSAPRRYKTKAKNAQEAHEAIRPTDFRRLPNMVSQYLDDDQRRLYELIWQRAVACQMEQAALDQVAIDFTSTAPAATLRATGSTVVFDGFLKLYREGRDDAEDEKEQRLPNVVKGERIAVEKVTPEQHFTQPPPRFTEASLVKKLEELGIGRPSTYASILQVLQDRNYVRLEKRRFVPEDRGRIVTAFLESFFARYVQYNFTADLENQLDDISGGRANWKEVLRQFWQAFSAAVSETANLRITDVLNALDEELGPHFFVDRGDGTDPRKCPSCDNGRLGLKLGKFGAFIGCSTYPECRYTRKLAVNGGEDGSGNGSDEPKLLGQHPDTGEPITVRVGPYGPYLQVGEDEKPKRVSLAKGLDPAEVDLAMAVRLLALPRDIGPHPESGAMMTAGIGRYGPYIKHEKSYRSLESVEDVLTIGVNRAVAILKEAKPRGGVSALRSLGDHPDDGAPVTVHKGRYGPYVKHGKVNATLPKDTTIEDITLEQALPLLAARLDRMKSGKASPKKAKGKTRTKKAKSARAKKATTGRADMAET